MRDFDIDSDLKQEKFQNIKLVQGDRGNKIKINVYEDGQPVNLAGCSVTAKYKRTDGEIINDGVIENIHDNSFDAVMDSSITKVAGTLKMLFTIEKDDVKVSTFLLLADVRESIGENTGSSGGNTGGGSGEVIIDLSNYYKKIETYSKNQIDARFKDIVKQTITTEERTKLNSLNNYDDTTVKTNIQNVQQQVNNLVLGAVGDGNNAEVVQARGNYTVLNDRFDSIEKDLYLTETLNSNNCIGFNDSTQPITANGVTLTVRNGAFELNGTATANTELNILSLQKSPMLEAAQYTFKVEKISGNTIPDNQSLKVYYTSNKMFDVTETESATVTFSEVQNRLKFRIIAGVQYNNYKFHFWGEKGSSCGDYKEYGHGSVKIEKHKKDFDNLNDHIENVSIHTTAEEKQAISELTVSSTIFVDEINDTANKIYNNMNGQCLCFAWISDTHTYPNYDSSDSSAVQYLNEINTIKFVNKQVGFDMLVHGGDMVNTQWLWKNPTTTNEVYGKVIHDYVNELRKTEIDNIYICMGNHDGGFIPNNTGSGVGTEYSNYKCFYKNSRQRVSDNKGKIVREGTKPYYYVDFDNLKLRCMFLATDMDSLKTDWKGMDYEQAEWIKNTLENIQTDYNVILFTHIPITRFYTVMSKGGSTTSIVNLLNGFNNHSTVDNQGSSLDADFSNKTGKILACFSGHYHGDSIILPSDEKAKFTFPEITITSGGYLTNKVITTGDFSNEADAPAREYGKVTQNAWDGVVYSKTDNKIYLTRFGAGEDRVIDLS